MLFIGTVMFMLFQTLPYFLGMPMEDGGVGIASQTTIGLFLLPNAITQPIFSPLGGKLGMRIGHCKVLALGLAITAIGLVSAAGFEVADREYLPNSLEMIRDSVKGAASSGAADVVLVIGGTGISGRDRSIEAVAPSSRSSCPASGSSSGASHMRRSERPR